MNTEYKVLDHGYCRYVDHMGKEESIIEAARMSTGKGFQMWGIKLVDNRDWITAKDTVNVLGDERLLAYLYKNKHMSPFEMVELVVEVQAPIFVVREWQRHRTFSFNEFSGRYAVMPDLHYVPSRDRICKQSKSNAQGSSKPVSDDVAEYFLTHLKELQTHEFGFYEDAILIDNIAKEIARINTPLARYTKMRAKANLRNWLQFLDLRLRENAQFEIRVYAEAVASIIKDLWPRTYALFEEYTLNAVTLGATEAKEKGLVK